MGIYINIQITQTLPFAVVTVPAACGPPLPAVPPVIPLPVSPPIPPSVPPIVLPLVLLLLLLLGLAALRRRGVTAFGGVVGVSDGPGRAEVTDVDIAGGGAAFHVQFSVRSVAVAR